MALKSFFAGAAPQGSSGYQQQVVSNAAQNARPEYLRSLNDASQRSANRGMLSSGAGQAEVGRVGEGFRNFLGGVSGQAAVDASQLQEQNRRRGEERQWYMDDLTAERAWQRKMMDEQYKRQQDAQGNGMWSDLLGGAAGALGGALGGPLGMVGGKYLSNWLSGRMGEPPEMLEEYGVPAIPDMDPGLPAGA